VNDRAFVARVVAMLAAHGVEVWVFGGWAEEMLGLAPPRPHADIDLLVAADDWTQVDSIELDQIAAKRFPHKRAFVLEGVMVELFLVQCDEHGLFTTFWNTRQPWPPDTLDDSGALPLASPASVRGYRADYRMSGGMASW
jgi:hypothetical protein